MYFMIIGDYMIGYSGMSNKFYCYDLTTGAYAQIASDV